MSALPRAKANAHRRPGDLSASPGLCSHLCLGAAHGPPQLSCYKQCHSLRAGKVLRRASSSTSCRKNGLSSLQSCAQGQGCCGGGGLNLGCAAPGLVHMENCGVSPGGAKGPSTANTEHRLMLTVILFGVHCSFCSHSTVPGEVALPQP